MKVIGSEAFFAEAGLCFAMFFLGLSGDAVHGLAVRYSTESNPRHFAATVSLTAFAPDDAGSPGTQPDVGVQLPRAYNHSREAATFALDGCCNALLAALDGHVRGWRLDSPYRTAG